MENEPCLETIDILNREKFIDRVLMVINSCRDQQKNLSFSIDGGWGYGKTFILDRVEKQLVDNWTVLRYDSWKYDYYEEPLVALIASISDQLQDDASGAASDIAKSAAKAAACMAWYCAAEAAGPLAFILKGGEKAFKDLRSAEKDDQKYDQYSSLKKNLAIMQNLLEKIGKEKPVVLMIDELDRCLPAYQVKVLERIHHVVNGQSCTVVYALNPDQLSETIRQIYGGNEDRVTAYLRKFLDFSLTLDTGMVSENIEQKHVLDIDAFEHDCGDKTRTAESDEWFQKVYTQLLSKLEIRVQEKLWQKRRTIHKIVFPQEDNPLPLIYLSCELMLLAMNEWKKRAYLPNSWALVSWSNNEENVGAFLHSGFRKKTNNDNDVILLPDNVQAFWKELCLKVYSSGDGFSSSESSLSRTYYIGAPIPKAAVLLASACTYADDSPYLQFSRSGDYKEDKTTDILVHLKQSMKKFNDFVKIMT